jgi:Ser/Thr protein kinase RdoA (MazF antagonist)
MSETLRSIGERFEIGGDLLEAGPHGSGHIHDTYAATYRERTATVRYVHQRLNTRIFADPERLMDNLVRVSEHLRRKWEARGVPDVDRRHLTVIRARDGRPFHVDASGHYWRTFVFLEGARTYDVVEGVEQAYQAARAFGAFAAMLADLPPPALSVTIPHFHDLGRRLAALETAAAADPCGRLTAVGPELERARRWRAYVDRALAEAGAARLPRRTVHNDCKLNNVMLDHTTGEGLCVIDLDTVMEGSALCDFGELVRTGTCRAPEDERDLAVIDFDLDLFRALARGYLAGALPLLDAAEIRALPLAGVVLTLENAIRFLADHLSGDAYFRIQRDGQNLDRCRAQFRLLELMVEHLDAVRVAVEQAARDATR